MAKYRVLIVDDEPDLRELLVETLSHLDCSIVTASNGKLALEKTLQAGTEKPFDAILSDINMPQMNGLDFLEKVRSAEIDTPFVFLTGYGDKEKAIRAMQLGAFDFLEKPYDSQVLQSTMMSAMDLGFQLRDIENQILKLAEELKIPTDKIQAFKNAQKTFFKMRALRSTKKVA